MKCCVKGCEATPMKVRFYRTARGPDAPWVCHAHYEMVEIKPEMKALHERWEDWFLGKEKKQ